VEELGVLKSITRKWAFNRYYIQVNIINWSMVQFISWAWYRLGKKYKWLEKSHQKQGGIVSSHYTKSRNFFPLWGLLLSFLLCFILLNCTYVSLFHTSSTSQALFYWFITSVYTYPQIYSIFKTKVLGPVLCWFWNAYTCHHTLSLLSLTLKVEKLNYNGLLNSMSIIC
jgi:hypothetical protein